MMRVALLVEYCGKDFHGSQYQPQHATVQAALQAALKALNLKTSAVTFAGRTDAGVNAQGHVAHFDIEHAALMNIPQLDQALNAVLPETVSVKAVQLDAGQTFHSRRDAEAKWYRYVFHNAANRSVWAAVQATTHHRAPLNALWMDQAAQALLGSHDFKSFKDSDTDVTNDVCDILYAKVFRDGDAVIFDIVANRFLYKMVRNLAGQLLLIGNTERLLPPESISQVLAVRDRRQAAATARPEGLTLMAIQYKSPFNFFAQDRNVRQLSNMINQSQMESLQDENLFRKAS